MANCCREVAQKCFSEESTQRQDDDIKSDLKIMSCEDGKYIKLILGFFSK